MTLPFYIYYISARTEPESNTFTLFPEMETDCLSSEEQSSNPEQQVVASHRPPVTSSFHPALHPESIDTTTTTTTTRTSVGNISECCIAVLI